MSKISVLEQKTFNNKPSGFKVTFDDGRSGNLNEKASDKGLRVGDNVVVTEIPYTSKAGVTSTLYGVKLVQGTPAQTPQQPSAPQTTPLTKTVLNFGKEQSTFTAKADATIKAMEFMIDCFIADKITWDQIKAKHTELTGYLNDAIDECNS